MVEPHSKTYKQNEEKKNRKREYYILHIKLTGFSYKQIHSGWKWIPYFSPIFEHNIIAKISLSESSSNEAAFWLCKPDGLILTPNRRIELNDFILGTRIYSTTFLQVFPLF